MLMGPIHDLCGVLLTPTNFRPTIMLITVLSLTVLGKLILNQHACHTHFSTRICFKKNTMWVGGINTLSTMFDVTIIWYHNENYRWLLWKLHSFQCDTPGEIATLFFIYVGEGFEKGNTKTKNNNALPKFFG